MTKDTEKGRTQRWFQQILMLPQYSLTVRQLHKLVLWRNITSIATKMTWRMKWAMIFPLSPVAVTLATEPDVMTWYSLNNNWVSSLIKFSVWVTLNVLLSRSCCLTLCEWIMFGECTYIKRYTNNKYNSWLDTNNMELAVQPAMSSRLKMITNISENCTLFIRKHRLQASNISFC